MRIAVGGPHPAPTAYVFSPGDGAARMILRHRVPDATYHSCGEENDQTGRHVSV
jgi:hypothetical protein